MGLESIPGRGTRHMKALRQEHSCVFDEHQRGQWVWSGVSMAENSSELLYPEDARIYIYMYLMKLDDYIIQYSALLAVFYLFQPLFYEKYVFKNHTLRL